MPIFRHKGDLHFFAHVPKCGGQSVEAYLGARFGNLAFLDNRFFARPVAQSWSLTSPQHVDQQTLASLFPDGWIRSSFAVVRHPLARLISAYNFQATHNRCIPNGMGIEEWFAEYRSLLPYAPQMHDNHLRPAVELIPEDATVFKLEDGLEPIVAYLDDLTGTKAPDTEIANLNALPEFGADAFTRAEVSPKLIAKAEKHFAADLKAYDYPPQPAHLAPVYVPAHVPLPLKAQSRPLRFQSRLRRRIWAMRCRILGEVQI